MIADPTTTVDPVDGSSSIWQRLSSGINSSIWRLSTSTPGTDWTDLEIRHRNAGNSAKPNSLNVQHNIKITRYKRDTEIDKIDKIVVSVAITAPQASVLTAADVLELVNTSTGFLVEGETETPLASGVVLGKVLFGES